MEPEEYRLRSRRWKEEKLRWRKTAYWADYLTGDNLITDLLQDEFSFLRNSQATFSCRSFIIDTKLKANNRIK